MKRFFYYSFFLIFLIALLLFQSCRGRNDSLVDEMKVLENETGEVSAKRVKEIKKEIKKYEQEVDDLVKSSSKTGFYYKLLGLEYMKMKMYVLAQESFEKAISFFPENEVVFYYAGVNAARAAKSKSDSSERMKLLEKAAEYYRRAYELDNGYTEPLYALSILDIFELNNPFEASGLLEKALSKDHKNISALFLLARAYAMTGRFRDALDVYGKIIAVSKDEQVKNNARELRDKLTAEVGK